MDWNFLLLFIAGFSSAMNLARLLRSPTKQPGWIAACVAVLGVAGVSYVALPHLAGYVAFTVWAVLMMAPAMLLRRILRATAAMDYRRAARLSAVARWLHPADGWWHQPRVAHANAAHLRGDSAEAARLLEPLQHHAPPTGLLARIHLLRLQRDWAGIAALAQQNRIHLRSGQLLPIYLRALGEQGIADGMVITYVQEHAFLQGEAMSVVHAHCRWMVLAFTGRTAALEALLDHHFPRLPPLQRRLWRARSELIAGLTEAATAELRQLATAAPTDPEREGIVAAEAQHALDHPPGPLQLMPAGHAILDQIDRDVRHDATYTVALHGVRARPMLTWALIAANCAMFGVEMQLGGTEDPETLLRLGAATTHEAFAHEWWRAITANFLHFGLAHLLMNMLALRALGPFIEQFIGRWRYAVLYAVAGVGAVAGTLWLQRQLLGDDEVGFLVGASGAIMGLVGANGAIFLRGWLTDRAAVAGRRLKVVLIIVGLQVVFDALTPQVSGTAHLLGLGIGFVVTLALMIGLKRPADRPVTQQPV